mmetsp:Transcript_17015/g.26855  ORF Transcript_17015/g.26855 Transcript_17015/m.26855 type:complete len:86 (-) Transcript_17015:921-1178(-)
MESRRSAQRVLGALLAAIANKWTAILARGLLPLFLGRRASHSLLRHVVGKQENHCRPPLFFWANRSPPTFPPPPPAARRRRAGVI